MTINDKIKDEELQLDINREAAKISALSSGKIDKDEYLVDEEILPRDKRRAIEQAKFSYATLGKAFEMIRTFGERTNMDEIALSVAAEDQSNLLNNIIELNEKTGPKRKEGKMRKRSTFVSVNALYEGRELTLNAFRSKIFPILKASRTQNINS